MNEKNKSSQNDSATEKQNQFQKSDDGLNDAYSIYSGKVVPDDIHSSDSSVMERLLMNNLIIVHELALKKNNTFVIQRRFLDQKIETDSTSFTFQGGESTLGDGTWSAVGGDLELKFLSGTVDSFFTDPRNGDLIKVIDNHTLRFHKSTEALWIWKTQCTRKQGKI